MPITKSATKALRQTISRRIKNISRDKKLKNSIKAFKNLIKDKKLDEAKKYFQTLQKTIDKMTKVKFIKKNKASRLKSRISKLLKNK